jgi:hypothetical protein
VTGEAVPVNPGGGDAPSKRAAVRTATTCMIAERSLRSMDQKHVLARIRALCLGFPETSERLSHGQPTFFVRDKRAFVMVLTNHHGDGRFAIWCAAQDGVQEMLVEADSERFFRPPYVGHRGWLGVRLDRGIHWDELTGIVEDAYAEVAPRKLVAAARDQEVGS